MTPKRKLEEAKIEILFCLETWYKSGREIAGFPQVIVLYLNLSSGPTNFLSGVKDWPEFNWINLKFANFPKTKITGKRNNQFFENSFGASLIIPEGWWNALITDPSFASFGPVPPLPQRSTPATCHDEQIFNYDNEVKKLGESQPLRFIKKRKVFSFTTQALIKIQNLIDAVGTNEESSAALMFLNAPAYLSKSKTFVMSPANLDSALKSCSKLVQSGCLSKGLCTLERFVNNETQTLVSNNQQEILQLHPQDSWDIRNEAPCLVPDEEFIIDPDLFLKCIATLPNKSSTSFSAWSFEIIKSLALSSQEFFDKLLTLFSKILNGHLFQSRDFWTSSRLICIRKAYGKLRPIAIGNV